MSKKKLKSRGEGGGSVFRTRAEKPQVTTIIRKRKFAGKEGNTRKGQITGEGGESKEGDAGSSKLYQRRETGRQEESQAQNGEPKKGKRNFNCTRKRGGKRKGVCSSELTTKRFLGR